MKDLIIIKFTMNKIILKKIRLYPVWSLNCDKDKDNKKNRFRWYYIREDSPYLKTNNIEKWKLIFPRTVAESIYRRTKILKPYEIFTDTFLCCFLDTEEQAKNLQTYFQTYLFRYLLINRATTQAIQRQIYSLIPNLTNIKNPRTNKIGWNSDWTNEDLQELFDLTNDEMEYIKDYCEKAEHKHKTTTADKDKPNKERKEKYGEVFTPPKVVNEMLDNLGEEVFKDINKTFFEPTCGNGNFLVEILKRKLKYCKDKEDKINSLKSIYAIELLEDNLLISKNRLLEIIKDADNWNKEELKEINNIIELNIQQGNTLLMINSKKEYIKFYDWKENKYTLFIDMHTFDSKEDLQYKYLLKHKSELPTNFFYKN